jgi:magnesium chelatase accessory protein
MLLIHGTGSSSHSWDGVAPALAADHALTIVDLPGHGRSTPLPPETMTLPGLAAAMSHLLTTIGVAPDVVVGHSAGAAIAVRMALDGRLPRTRALVGINAALLPFPGVAGLVFPPLARLIALTSAPARILAWRATMPDAVENLLAGTGGRLPHATVETYRRLLANPGHVKATLDMMAMWDLRSLRQELPRLATPLELIVGGEDLAVPAEDGWRLRDIVANCRVHYLRHLGHLAHEQEPETVAHILRRICNVSPAPSEREQGRADGEARRS